MKGEKFIATSMYDDFGSEIRSYEIYNSIIAFLCLKFDKIKFFGNFLDDFNWMSACCLFLLYDAALIYFSSWSNLFSISIVFNVLLMR